MTGWSAVKFVVAAAFALSANALHGQEIPQREVTAAEVEAFVDGVVKSVMERDHIAGTVVSVVHDGELLLCKGYGIAAVRPERPVDCSTTMFRIGSIGKTLTWVAAMQQAERGRLDLDADINRILPPGNRIPDQGFERPIRFVDLMAHAGGFEDRIFGHLFYETADRVKPTAQYLRDHRPDRVREAGTFSSYSNFGAALAGFIVTHVSGVPDYPTLLERNIFAPLGMTMSSAREVYPPRQGLPAPIDAAKAALRSDGFVWNGHEYERQTSEYITSIMPAGGHYSTGRDMSLYMRALLADGAFEGGRLFGERAAAAFRTPVMKLPAGFSGWNHGFVSSRTEGGVPIRWHNGATFNFTANMVLVPSRNFGVFINANTANSGGLTGALPGLLIDRLFGGATPAERAGQPARAAAMESYAGTYMHSRRAYSKLEGMLGLLTSQVSLEVTPDGFLRMGGTDYVPAATPGLFDGRKGRDQLLFHLGADGRPQSFVQDSASVVWTRVAPYQSMTLLLVLIGLTVLTALLVLLRWLYVGAGAASRRELWSDRLLSAIAVCWLATFAGMGVWAVRAEEVAKVAFDFPGPLLGAAAGLATIAILATPVAAALVFAGWRRGGSWTRGRLALRTLAVLIFAALGLQLALWGILPPWT